MLLLNCTERSAIKDAAIKCGYEYSGYPIQVVDLCKRLVADGERELARQVRITLPSDIEEIIHTIRSVVLRQ